VRSAHTILKAVQGQHGRDIEALRAAQRPSGEDDAVPAQLRSLELVINEAHGDLQAVHDEQRKQGRELQDLGQELGRVAGDFEGLRRDVGRAQHSVEDLQTQHVNEMELLQNQNSAFVRELEVLKNSKGNFNWPWQCTHPPPTERQA